MEDLKSFLISAKDASWPDFGKLTNWSYLTDTAVPVQSSLLSVLAYFFILLIIAGLVLNYYLGKKNKKIPVYSAIRSHIFNLAMWLGGIGLFLVIARFEALYMLSSRMLLLVLLIIFLAWTIWIIVYTLSVLPQKIKDYHKKQNYQKYLPKKKKIIR